jgi:farnesyl-diphosphate farnesyltransferase
MSPLSQQDALTGSFAYCWQILPHVSRTFALTIPTLEEPLRGQVGVSYLLCRIADTIEDRVGLDPPQRLTLFHMFRDLVHSPGDSGLRAEFSTGWPRHPDPHHQDLVEHTGTVLDCYAAMDPSAREAIAQCIDEMVTGMERYPGPSERARPVEICPDLDALEEYCHYVAGTVGVLLSRLFATNLSETWLTPERQEDGRRFGLGLQLTNVIKDQGKDRERGVSYIPEAWITEDASPRLTREGTRILIGRAVEHLDAAQKYILGIPPERSDMRLFCLWAAHLALATLKLAADPKAAASGAKIGREELWVAIERARTTVADDAALEDIHQEYRQAVLDCLNA